MQLFTGDLLGFTFSKLDSMIGITKLSKLRNVESCFSSENKAGTQIIKQYHKAVRLYVYTLLLQHHKQ